MASVVEICNRALQNLGAKRIVSVDDNSVNARACNVAYGPMRISELRKHNWNFAIQRFQLAANPVPPAFGRANSFPLPENFIRLLNPDPVQTISVRDRNVLDVDWQIEGQQIFTNDQAPLQVRCVCDVTDPNVMDPLFREALSAWMAYELAEEITQSNQKKADALIAYKDIVQQARLINAIESPAADAPTDFYITVRQ